MVYLLAVKTVKVVKLVPNKASTSVNKNIAINISAMDKSIKPGDNFYLYANGNWMKTTKIPVDRSNTGAFLVAFEETEKTTRAYQ